MLRKTHTNKAQPSTLCERCQHASCPRVSRFGCRAPAFPPHRGRTSVRQTIFLRAHLLQDNVYPEQYMDITTGKEG